MYIHSLTVLAISIVIFFTKRQNNIWDYRDIINILTIMYVGIINMTMLFMVLMQTYLISYNKTTNECCRGRFTDKNPFDKNCCDNWREVLNT